MFEIDNYVTDIENTVEESFKDYLFENFCETHSAKYGGSFLTKTGDVIFIKRVIYEKPKVIIIWNDGTKSTASCAPVDEAGYNFESGLNIAINNRLYGHEEMQKLYTDWLPDLYYTMPNPNSSYTYIVDIKDVRKYHKALAKTEWQVDKEKFEEAIADFLRDNGYSVVKEK